MSELGLSIANSGLNAAQQSMDTVSENLANVNTPGYIQETATLEANPSINNGVGGGVNVEAITQLSSAVLEANTNSAQSTASNLTAVQQNLTEIQAIFPEPSGNGLSTQLSTFWQAWDAINQNPSNPTNLGDVIGQARGLATSLSQASQQLTTTQNGAASNLDQTTTTVNSLLSQVANLNESIVTTGASGATATSLIDQRNALVSQLATDIGATTRPQSNGAVDVYVGGLTAVQGNVADSFTVSVNAGVYSLVSNTSGNTAPVQGGKIAGLLTELNTDIPNYQNQLNGVAADLANTVNNQLALGYTSTGVSGSAAATVTGSAPLAAATTINLGVNDTINLTANGGPYALTLAPGTYTPTQLTAAFNAAAGVAGAPVTAALNATGGLLLSTTTTGPAANLQITGGDGLAGLNLAAGPVSVGGNGLPLFTVGGAVSPPVAGSITAADLTINPTLAGNSLDLAIAGSQPTPPAISTNDGSNAQALANLFDAAGGPDQAYQTMITGLGAQLQSVNSQVSTQGSLVSGLSAVQQSVEGVDTNQQTVDMLSYQQAYQASAKVISIIDSMMQSLINAV